MGCDLGVLTSSRRRVAPFSILLVATGAVHPGVAAAQTLQPVGSVTLTTDAEGGGARPEIVAYAGRFHVVYLAGFSLSTPAPEHRARTYAGDAFQSPVTQTLVAASAEYGKPTDVRVVREADALYVFWEQANEQTSEARLFGAKYQLGTSLTLLAQPASPIALAPYFTNVQTGDELVNDPTPFFAWGKLFVMTRIKTGLTQVSPVSTIYRLRELDPATLSTLGTLTLNLSDAMEGPAQVNSLVAEGSNVWHIQPTLVSTGNLDLAALRMDSGWQYNAASDMYALTNDSGLEVYPTGARMTEGKLYVVYEKPAQPGDTAFPIHLKVFDASFQTVAAIVVTPEGTLGTHPTVEVVGSRVYVAYGTGTNGGFGGPGANAVVNIYEWVVDAVPLASPADNTSTLASTPTFSWNAVAGAASYEIQVDGNGSTFPSPEIDVSSVAATSFVPGAPLNEGTYSWHVRGVDAAGDPGAWSAAWTFHIVTSSSVPLSPGWTLVSWPVKPVTTSSKAADLAAQISSSLVEAIRETQGGQWDTWTPGDPTLNNFEIEFGKAYFVKTTQPATWEALGLPVAPGEQVSTVTLSLGSGYDGIGIPLPAGAHTASSLAGAINTKLTDLGITGAVTHVRRWDGSLWTTYEVGVPSGDFTIQPDTGYVLVLSDMTDSFGSPTTATFTLP